jgi:hypothetical protein
MRHEFEQAFAAYLARSKGLSDATRLLVTAQIAGWST